MTAAKRQPSQSQSVLIQFRWNWQTEQGRRALETVQGYANQYTDGDIGKFRKAHLGGLMADALLNFAGQKLSTRATNAEILARLKRIEQAQHEQFEALMAALRGFDLSQYVHRETGNTFEDDLGEVIPDQVRDTILSGVRGKSFDVD